MEIKISNREWVKNAAIIFLAVLLVLTFFSNTIMNRSLVEIATAQVKEGNIVAKVRGTGTVTASGKHQVKARETRTIRSVSVKKGQEVKTGDILFVLGEGDATELEQAQETLRALQYQYQKASATLPTFTTTAEENALWEAQTDLDNAQELLDEAERNYRDMKEKLKEGSPGFKPDEAIVEQAKKEAAETYQRYIEIQDSYNESFRLLSDELAVAQEHYNELVVSEESDPAEVEAAKQLLDAAQNELDDFTSMNKATLDAAKSAYEAAKENYESYAEFDTKLNVALAPYKEAIELAEDVYARAENAYNLAYENLCDKQVKNESSYQSASIDLAEISEKIARQEEKVNKLAGTDGNTITANVNGVIDTIDCTAGDTVSKDTLLCTIEVPDMGHTLSFSVTNEQAQRLRIGDSASVSNYYWGSSITAKLTTIRTDPKNPQTNKLLTFDLDGEVTSGAELTLSVGSKSASYDTVIPNSSIRSDTNGSFVFAVNAKNSALGNRYFAKRVSVEVLASDDVNSAVVADLERGDFVITTGSAPIKNGDQVRMADNNS